MPLLDIAPDDYLVVWGDNYNVRKHGLFFNYPDTKWWLCDYGYKESILVVENTLDLKLVDQIHQTFGGGLSRSISRELIYIVIPNRDDDTLCVVFDSI
jgi:hypothetical protein